MQGGVLELGWPLTPEHFAVDGTEELSWNLRFDD